MYIAGEFDSYYVPDIHGLLLNKVKLSKGDLLLICNCFAASLYGTY